MNSAFLLAAGFGTRLRPLTLVRPKALLPVCGVPMLDYALALAASHGHDRVLVNAHHLWRHVGVWASQRGAELQVELPVILGTGGGLRAALDRVADPVVIVNADVLSDVDLTALAAACPQDGAAMALRADPEAAAIGPVEADAEGRVVRITNVVTSGVGEPGTHFTGVHAMSRAAISAVPPEGEQCVIRTAYRQLVPEGLVRAVRHAGAWVDIGAPAAYLQANLDVLAGNIVPALDPWTRGDRRGDCWVGPDAVVRGEVAGSVVGDGAVVPAGAHLRRCVVWDGVTVPEGDHEGVVFYGEAGEVGRALRV